jgi:hypothetical protein
MEGFFYLLSISNINAQYPILNIQYTSEMNKTSMEIGSSILDIAY